MKEQMEAKVENISIKQQYDLFLEEQFDGWLDTKIDEVGVNFNVY